MSTKAYGAHAADRPLEALTITRREPGPHDVVIEIAYCGVCHSDLHQVRSEWGGTHYPFVPGHEIVGHVRALGRRPAAVRGWRPVPGRRCRVSGQPAALRRDRKSVV